MAGVNFGEVKRMVGMRDLLAHYGAEVRCCNPATQQHKGRCPLPTHSHNHVKESFSANLERDCWKCWAPSCGEGGVLDFVKEMEGCSLLEAAKKIIEWFGVKPKKQSPPLETEGSDQIQTNLKPESNTLPFIVQEKSEPKKRRPVWAHIKSPAETSDEAQTGSQPVPQEPSAPAPPVKAGRSGFMQEVDDWFDGLVRRGTNESDAEYWHRIRNEVKKRLLDNYRNGQKDGRKEVARSA